MPRTIFTVLCFYVYVALCQSYFPPDIRICSIKDPNINECFKESANKMMKYLAKGIPSLNAISMDPLVVKEIIVPKGNALLPTLSCYVQDMHLYGWKDGYFTRTEIDIANRAIELQFVLPVLHERGLYEIDGSLGSVPVQGNSDFEAYFRNFTFNMRMKVGLQNHFGQNYFVIEQFNNKVVVEDAVFDLRNLFNDQKLSKIANERINSNMEKVLMELTPLMSSLYGNIARTLIQRILNSVPLEALFTDIDDQYAFSIIYYK